MNILLGVDGSEHGFAAVEFAGRLIDPTLHKIGLVHSCGPVALTTGEVSEALVERAQNAVAQVIFDEAIKRLPPAIQGAVQTFTGTERPAELLLRIAKEWPASVICVGARGLSTLETLLLGSVSSEIVRTATLPVLVFRPETNKEQPLQVLVAYAKGSAELLRTALNATHWPTGTIGQLISVIEPYDVPGLPDWVKHRARAADTEAWSKVWVREHEQERAQQLTELTEFAETLPSCFQQTEPLVAEGNPAEVILEQITKQKTNLVVVGKQAKGLLDRLILGSTSERILNYASCSVLILPS